MLNSNRNDVTGDLIQTKPATKLYEEGWERIFGKKQKILEDQQQQENNDDDNKNQQI